jgi:tetratricopeptide (TPR) repeat protein
MFYSRSRLAIGLIAVPILLVLRYSGVLPNVRYTVHQKYTVQDRQETPQETRERNAEVLFDRGVESLNSQDYEAAIDFFTRVIDRVADNPGAYGNRAIAYEKRNDLPHAMADYAKALKLDPNNADLYSSRGLCFFRQGDYDRALSDFNEAIRCNAHDAEYYVLRGQVHGAKNTLDLALADFSEALKLDPLKAGAYAGRGLVYFKKKDYAHALNDYQKAIELSPKESSYYVERSDVFSAQKDYERADADLTVAIALDASNAEAYLARALLRQDRHDYKRAIDDYAEAIRINNKELLAFNNLAWIFATCPQADYRDGGRAVEFALHLCKESEWKKTTYFDTLAAAYAASGNFAEAAKWQERALASPDSYDSAQEKQKGKARLALYLEHKPYFEE